MTRHAESSSSADFGNDGLCRGLIVVFTSDSERSWANWQCALQPISHNLQELVEVLPTHVIVNAFVESTRLPEIFIDPFKLKSLSRTDFVTGNFVDDRTALAVLAR